MHKSPLAWLAALWIAILIHVDWHLGRPGHDHLSFGLPYHWLLGVATLGPVPWLVIRRWPTSFAQASAFMILVGVVLGQGVEPLGEVILYDVGLEPFTNRARWRIFAEFMAAAIPSYVVATALVRSRSRRATA